DVNGLSLGRRLTPEQIGQDIAESIRAFEPRILPETLSVKSANGSRRSQEEAGGLSFTIEGELWSSPVPEPLFLQTQFDREGHASLSTE
ncbi:MAG: GPW/gp25 family protein, partial [Verrucomicrobiota bacterium]